MPTHTKSEALIEKIIAARRGKKPGHGDKTLRYEVDGKKGCLKGMREYVFHPDDEKYFKLTKNDKPTLAIAVPKSYKYLAEEGARFCVENNTSAYRAVNTYLYEKFDCVVGTMCRNMNWKQLKESFKEGIQVDEYQYNLMAFLDGASADILDISPQQMNSEQLSERFADLTGRVEKDLKQIKKQFDERLAQLEKRLDGHDERLNNHEEQLDAHDERFEQQDARMDKQEVEIHNLREQSKEQDARMDEQDVEIWDPRVQSAKQGGQIRDLREQIEAVKLQQQVLPSGRSASIVNGSGGREEAKQMEEEHKLNDSELSGGASFSNGGGDYPFGDDENVGDDEAALNSLAPTKDDEDGTAWVERSVEMTQGKMQQQQQQQQQQSNDIFGDVSNGSAGSSHNTSTASAVNLNHHLRQDQHQQQQQARPAAALAGGATTTTNATTSNISGIGMTCSHVHDHHQDHQQQQQQARPAAALAGGATTTTNATTSNISGIGMTCSYVHTQLTSLGCPANRKNVPQDQQDFLSALDMEHRKDTAYINQALSKVADQRRLTDSDLPKLSTIPFRDFAHEMGAMGDTKVLLFVFDADGSVKNLVFFDENDDLSKNILPAVAYLPNAHRIDCNTSITSTLTVRSRTLVEGKEAVASLARMMKLSNMSRIELEHALVVPEGRPLVEHEQKWHPFIFGKPEIQQLAPLHVGDRRVEHLVLKGMTVEGTQQSDLLRFIEEMSFVNCKFPDGGEALVDIFKARVRNSAVRFKRTCPMDAQHLIELFSDMCKQPFGLSKLILGEGAWQSALNTHGVRDHLVGLFATGFIEPPALQRIVVDLDHLADGEEDLLLQVMSEALEQAVKDAEESLVGAMTDRIDQKQLPFLLEGADAKQQQFCSCLLRRAGASRLAQRRAPACDSGSGISSRPGQEHGMFDFDTGQQQQQQQQQNQWDNPSQQAAASAAPEPPKVLAKSRTKLGGGGGKKDSLIAAMAAKDNLLPLAGGKQAAASAFDLGAAPAKPVTNVPSTPLSLVMEEKISCAMNREGAVESCEVKGTLILTANTDAGTAALVAVNKRALPSTFNFATHPKVDKKRYEKDGVLSLKGLKGFPMGRPVGILRWSYAGEDAAPLTINCWPEDEGTGQINVNIEMELTRTDLVLHDVHILLPLGTTEPPSINEIDGQFEHDPQKGMMFWHFEQVDASTRTASLEFRIPGQDLDAFFPVQVFFRSEKLLCPIEITSVSNSSSGTTIGSQIFKSFVAHSYQCA